MEGASLFYDADDYRRNVSPGIRSKRGMLHLVLGQLV